VTPTYIIYNLDPMPLGIFPPLLETSRRRSSVSALVLNDCLG
jgi:hypothetical protein